jgi:alcohol dehydrogenase class IV
MLNNNINRIIDFYYPKQVTFGCKSHIKVAEDIYNKGFKKIFIITINQLLEKIDSLIVSLRKHDIEYLINTDIIKEPTFADFEKILSAAINFDADIIIGIGGGSVLDVAKLLAVQIDSKQPLKSIIGTGHIKGRNKYLICIPTTSGTGSEASPNAILTDNEDMTKKGIISNFLIPDKLYIDPELMIGLPPDITAFTGIDALTHCIEAYTNKYSHPLVDNFALEGIRLIVNNLPKAFINGSDIEARLNLAIGSFYGGLCLGPVNTAAVHALAYPLQSIFKIPHGIANSIMLPYVIEYNILSAPYRYACIYDALEGFSSLKVNDKAKKFSEQIRVLLKNLKLPLSLNEVGIKKSDIEIMAKSAYDVQRLLKNNIRDLSIEDIKIIYQKAF